MAGTRGFDEVMIVNPSPPGDHQGARHMRFHYAPQVGYYAEPVEYGYYAEPPEYGYYAEPELAEPMEYGWYAETPEVGYFAEEAPYGEAEPVAGWAEPEFAGWGEPEAYGEVEPGYAEEPIGYFAEEYPAGYGYGEEPYAGWAEADPYGEAQEFAEVPEMVGYGEPEPLAEDPMSGWVGEPEFQGYVRDTPPPFNAGCPMPTNVSGFEEAVPLEGYIRPGDVSPTCEAFTPQPGPTPSVPETFKPLW
jgi:hypothetical protein